MTTENTSLNDENESNDEVYDEMVNSIEKMRKRGTTLTEDVVTKESHVTFEFNFKRGKQLLTSVQPQWNY